MSVVATEASGGILTVTVNRPDKLNALNPEVLDALGAAFEGAARDESVRGVIVTGAGEKAFVAGADIATFQALQPVSASEYARQGQRVLDRIEAFEKPVVAAVNGFALGGGCELAMACHLRVASTKAKFGQPEVNLGLIPGFAGTQRLPRLVGRGRALELILTGDMIDAQEAWRIGLVNRVVEPDALLPACRELLGKIGARAPLAVRFAIEAVHRGLQMPLAEAQEHEASLFGLCASTEDMREGVDAFLNKRAPAFRGK